MLLSCQHLYFLVSRSERRHKRKEIKGIISPKVRARAWTRVADGEDATRRSRDRAVRCGEMKKAGRHLRTPPSNGQIRNDPLGKKSPPFDSSTLHRPEPVCWGSFSKVNLRAWTVKRHPPRLSADQGFHHSCFLFALVGQAVHIVLPLTPRGDVTFPTPLGSPPINPGAWPRP